MSWNYRIFKDTEARCCCLSFREVYYDPDGAPVMYTESEVSPTADTLDDLKRKVSEALTKPILTEKDFKE